MRKSFNRSPAGETFGTAREQIENGDFEFYMRNKKQQEYHPSNVENFTHEHYRLAYILQDMAMLCTSLEISNYITDIAYHLRNGDYHRITKEDLTYTVKFVQKGKNKYQNTDFVDLTSLLSV